MSRSPEKIKSDIIAYAKSLGFDRVGITSAEPFLASEEKLGAWVGDGCAGEMSYMVRDWQKRARPGELLPGARTIIALAASYYVSNAEPPRAGQGKVARYAWGRDYHKVLGKRLEALVRYISALAPNAVSKTYLDTGPLLERAVAQRAGLGFIGKNTMLITRGLGSWVFLASVVTDLKLPVDSADARHCGSCTLCIDACPTQAITEPFRLDARRCISYMTIEAKEAIPENLKPKLGNWAFGCDVCQEVCPHNARVAATTIAEFTPAFGSGPTINLEEVMALKNEAEFDSRFARTPLKRTKRAGLQRNALAVSKNQK
jgi:epoxyqueuosine reductase